MASKEHGNRLGGELSPYLLQHAENPVPWFPWGNEAFERARRLDRPIFLSIGYAACHWCHVMAHESFEDPEVATFLADHFVSVKVDREERPDVDAVYMTAVQMLTGSGGWPLSVFLTPSLDPFFGGTYFPPRERWGQPAFIDVLNAVAQAWESRRDEILLGAAEIKDRLVAPAEVVPNAVDAADLVPKAVTALARRFDPRWGGFGAAPKFPAPARLRFLVGLAARGDQLAHHLVAATLDGMAAGGMRDWLGGGFHRYSVDAQWLVPHFERMLYDNALLARTYGEAGVRLGVPQWVRVAREAADWLLAEMRGEEGAFYSSSDADTEGVEGATFTWTQAEVRAALPDRQAAVVQALCGLDKAPNFEGDRFVLRPDVPLDEVAGPLGLSVDAVATLVEEARRTLLAARARRPAPSLDDKRLAGWNGMAVWALAWLGATLGEGRYLEAAQRCGRFLIERMSAPDGGLRRAWRDAVTGGSETLEDVAWVGAGLVALFSADANVAWLRAALGLVDCRLPHYVGSEGQLFEAPDDGERLPARPRTPADGATPSAIAVMVETLLDLAAITGRSDLEEAARAAVHADAATLRAMPESCTALLEATARLSRAPVEVVIVGNPDAQDFRELEQAARRARRAPDVIVLSPGPVLPTENVALVPLYAGRERAETGKAVAYLCRGGACLAPTSAPAELAAQLSGENP